MRGKHTTTTAPRRGRSRPSRCSLKRGATKDRVIPDILFRKVCCIPKELKCCFQELLPSGFIEPGGVQPDAFQEELNVDTKRAGKLSESPLVRNEHDGKPVSLSD